MGKKLILGTLAVIALVAAVVVWRAIAGLDGTVAAVIETTGSEAFQTEVDARGVRVDLRDARVHLAALEIHNPEGFSSAKAVELRDITVRIAPKTLMEPVVEVRELTVAEPLVRLELKADGSSNLAVLRDNIESTMSAAPGQDPILLIIDRLNIAEIPVEATVSTPSGEEERSFSMAPIEMRNLGRSQGGLTPEQVAQIVGREVLDQSLSALARQGLKSLIEEQTDRLKDEILDRLGGD